MGVVVAATHLQLDERVAIKFLLPDDARATRRSSQRFLREARAAVKHQERARRARARRRDARDGAPVHGHGVPRGAATSASCSTSSGRAPVERRGRLRAPGVRGARRGARARHRAPRPQAGEPLPRRSAPTARRRVKVLDFGISKAGRPSGRRRAASPRRSAVMGSPLYMSPEQMRSSQRRRRAHRHLGARRRSSTSSSPALPPFDAETMTELVRGILQDPPPLRCARAGRTCRRQLEAVVCGASRRTATARFANVAQLPRRSRRSGRRRRARRPSASRACSARRVHRAERRRRISRPRAPPSRRGSAAQPPGCGRGDGRWTATGASRGSHAERARCDRGAVARCRLACRLGTAAVVAWKPSRRGADGAAARRPASWRRLRNGCPLGRRSPMPRRSRRPGAAARGVVSLRPPAPYRRPSAARTAPRASRAAATLRSRRLCPPPVSPAARQPPANRRTFSMIEQAELSRATAARASVMLGGLAAAPSLPAPRCPRRARADATPQDQAVAQSFTTRVATLMTGEELRASLPEARGEPAARSAAGDRVLPRRLLRARRADGERVDRVPRRRGRRQGRRPAASARRSRAIAPTRSSRSCRS